MPFSEKYAPTTLNQIAGNESAVGRLVDFGIRAHGKERLKPILIYGPSGTGKSAAAHALAHSNGFDIIELNASDYRDSETLNRTLLPAGKSSGLFNKHQIIILDEIDERSDKFDSGSEKVITQLIKESRHPIILIANDYWDRKITFLREIVERLEFKRVNREEIKKVLEGILAKEGKSMDWDVLGEIVGRCNGDLRGAINDLELMVGAKLELLENLGRRDRKLEVYGVLDNIFMTRSFEMAREAYNNTDLDSDMLLNWIDENIPNRYSWRSDVINAYANLAKASFFLGQASRKSYYGYLRYSGILMSCGVSLSANGQVADMRSYAFPNNIRQLSKSKSSRGAMNIVMSKLVYVLHAHKKDIFNGYIQLLREMAKEGQKEVGSEEMEVFFERTYNLDKDDMKAITGSS
ncbi:MAG: replication factor C large subunit [Candidatus Micrarchaeota archaeon]|nr:replication factor C large subunit [Candidatus Micrarchaeota archaeon]MDE1848254.1 replication factor C large subunit [Candidatus Micrarchaeota archaeon]MDE1864392.1 replication factor C large subunit [Candidatus Micrarchaeota archaeon]